MSASPASERKNEEAVPSYCESPDQLIRAERKLMNPEREPEAGTYTGLALSGGGIRSASFGLGVLQGLVRKGLLEKIDYLSTVSGGGYIGTSLTWWLHTRPGAGTRPESFPLGMPPGSAEGDGTTAAKSRATLNYLRQHANYLTPTGRLNALSLFGVFARGILSSMTFYFGLLVVLMYALYRLPGVVSGSSVCNLQAGRGWLLAAGAMILVAYAAAIFFSLLSGVLGSSRKGGASRKYVALLNGQTLLGRLWTLVLILLLFGSIPFVYDLLPDSLDEAVSIALSVGGAVMGYFRARSGGPEGKGGVSSLMIVVSVAMFLYGLTLCAYAVYTGKPEDLVDELLSTQWGRSVSPWLILGAFLVLLLSFGALTNLNHISHHRMYRDRLMELFLPDDDTVLPNDGSAVWKPAKEADRCRLEDVPAAQRPYHLINTNVVLVSSPTPRYRSRGGDNFILSPGFCGSAATGWRETRGFAKGTGLRGMTLPTAMAISAAAMNPNTGAEGGGPTRSRLVSALMNMLDLRLGYFVSNPNREEEIPRPNYLNPGLASMVAGSTYQEGKRRVELTDGGHFDNTALYELIRRRCAVIIASDAGADSRFEFGSLATLVERVRADFEAVIRFRTGSLERLDPACFTGKLAEKYGLSESGFAVADIEYARTGEKGVLIYLKSTLIEALPFDIYGYKSRHPTFPDQTTADQFFDEAQFEAYRELGYQLTMRTVEEIPRTYPEDEVLGGFLPTPPSESG